MKTKTSPRLLIVDDELHVRESLSHWFTEDGYDVEAAASGKEKKRYILEIIEN